MHRVCNGIFASSLCAFAGIGGLYYLNGISALAYLSGWLLYLSPFVVILCGILNPKRFPITVGLAGELAYEGLNSENEWPRKKA